MSGASVRLSWFIWNSHSKSEITRSPFTITVASQRRAKSTTSSRNASTSTLPRWESASFRSASRSSSENIGALCWGAPTTPATTRSKMRAARAITSTCPLVTGSYVPGQIAVITGRSSRRWRRQPAGKKWRQVLKKRQPRGAVPARGADGEALERGLVAGGGLVDEEAVPGEHAAEVRREPVGAGVVVGRVAEDEVVRPRLGRERPEDVLAADAPLQTEPLEVRRDRAAGLPVGLDEHRARGAAGERLEAERPRAGEQVEHRHPLDRPDQAEGGLADAVGGRPRPPALRRRDPVALPAPGDDPHPAQRRPRRGRLRYASSAAAAAASSRSASSSHGPSSPARACASSRARASRSRSARSRVKRRSPSPDWRVPRSCPSPRSSRSRSASSNPSLQAT